MVEQILHFTKLHAFYKQHFFISKARLKLAKSQPKDKQHPEAELLTNMSKKLLVCVKEIVSFVAMKMIIKK